MNFYRCYLFNRTGIEPGCRAIRAQTETQAKRVALDLLRENPLIERMEVWREADLAFRLSRNQARMEGEL